MHAFTTDLPEHHAIAGLSPAANTALVVCGYHPGEECYYGMIAGAPTAYSGTSWQKPDLRRDGLSLPELLKWLEEKRIGLPGGLRLHLRRDGLKDSAQPWQKFYWGEQGPELQGIVDPARDRDGSFGYLFFGLVATQKAV